MTCSLTQAATSEPLSRERWEGLGKIYRDRPIRRQEMVSNCTAIILAMPNPDFIKEIEQRYGMSGARAAAQFCADYYESIGDGSLKYEDVYGETAPPAPPGQ
ncbi:hypothetical protein CYK37_10265 [Mesorhizobium loti]|nr:hypothetical protein CYK37_10265 [Mesorhizobium loti]